LAGAALALISAVILIGCGKPKETPIQKAERLLSKGDAASLEEAKTTLQEALKGEPNSARMHALLASTYIKEAKSEQSRDKSEEIYNLAMGELGKALEHYGQAGAPIDVYRQTVDVCRERAYLPKRFNVEKEIEGGVGPWEVKAMEKAIKAYDLGRARFPQDPAFTEDGARSLQNELAALKTLYVENVHRAWLSRPSGFVSPDKQKQVQ